jgi:hypothetical protein
VQESDFDLFQKLNSARKREVHFILCEYALNKWDKYIAQNPEIRYVDSVVGMAHTVENTLPREAFESAKKGEDLANIGGRYSEPIVSLQDEDLEFPEPIVFAYYAIYNLFQRYVLGINIDDWLIANQALASEPDMLKMKELFLQAILKSLELSPIVLASVPEPEPEPVVEAVQRETPLVISPSPAHSACIEAQIDAQPTGLGYTVSSICRSNNLLLLHANIIYFWGIQPDGKVMCGDHESFSPGIEPETNNAVIYAVLLQGLAYIPELKDLIPACPDGVIECDICGGKGWTLAESCMQCDGYGWYKARR